MAAARFEVSDGVAGWLSDVAIGDLSIWLFVSDGLRAFGHPELALPVRAHPQLEREATARALVGLLRAIAQVAANGQRVAPGGTTRLGGQLLGFDGLLYLPATPIGDHFLPQQDLVGLLASADELAGVEQFGARRIASLLARQTRYYPYPPWSDPGRERFTVSAWPSVLVDMPRVSLPGASVTQESGALHLRLGRVTTAPVMRSVLAQLPPDVPPTFTFAHVAPSADACLVWSPNQQAPEAVAPPGSRGERLGGCFLATANQQAANGSQVIEDGFAYFLRDADYTQLRAALESGRDLVVRGERPGDDLVVTWVDEEVSQQEAPRRVRLVGVELVTEPTGDSDATLLADYIRALAAVAETVFPSINSPYEARVHVQIDRGQPAIQIATRPITPPQDVLQRCFEALQALPAPRLTVAFYAHLAVNA